MGASAPATSGVEVVVVVVKVVLSVAVVTVVVMVGMLTKISERKEKYRFSEMVGESHLAMFYPSVIYLLQEGFMVVLTQSYPRLSFSSLRRPSVKDAVRLTTQRSSSAKDAERHRLGCLQLRSKLAQHLHSMR
jgi:hypothetical protein